MFLKKYKKKNLHQDLCHQQNPNKKITRLVLSKKEIENSFFISFFILF